jgi:hypothetical protein
VELKVTAPPTLRTMPSVERALRKNVASTHGLHPNDLFDSNTPWRDPPWRKLLNSSVYQKTL